MSKSSGSGSNSGSKPWCSDPWSRSAAASGEKKTSWGSSSSSTGSANKSNPYNMKPEVSILGEKGKDIL